MFFVEWLSLCLLFSLSSVSFGHSLSSQIIKSVLAGESFKMTDEVDLNNEEWKNYKAEFQKVYKDQVEEIERFKLYFENKKLVEEHNAKYQRGEVTFEMGINQFSDRRNDEHPCGVGGCLRKPK